MKRKFFTAMLAVLAVIFAFSACSKGDVGDIINETTKLNAPTNVRVENDVIKWSSVSGAGSYVVQIGSEVNQATTTYLEYPISSLLSQSASGLYVKVKALPSNMLLYSESDWSSLYGPVDYVPSSTPSNNYAEDYANNQLGRSINMITATDFETWSGSVSIFDTSKLYNIRLIEQTVGKQEAASQSGNSFYDFANKWSLDVSSKTSRNAGLEIPSYALGLSSSFSVNLSGGYEVAKESETKQFFYKLRQTLVGKRLEISGYKQTSTFSNILSEEFLSDAQKVNVGQMTADTFVQIYGTHVIMAAYYGGAIEANYYSIEHKDQINEEWYANLESNLTAALTISDINAGFSSDNSANYSQFVSNTAGKKMTYFNAKAVGGSSRSFGNMESFASNYASWAETVNEDTYSLIDVPNESLYCVWDYLPSSYANAKNILNEYLLTECSEYYNQVCAKFGNVTNKDNVSFDEKSNTLTIDLKEFQYSGVITNINNPNYSNGILTIYPKFNGIAIENIIVEGLYMEDDSQGVDINTLINNFSIKFHEAWSSNVNLTLKSVGYNSLNGYPALDFSALSSGINVNIIVEGINYLAGGFGTAELSAGAGILGKNISITSLNSTDSLTVYGGNGADARSTEESGIKGESAIISQNLVVKMNGTLKAIGGNGGAGARGYDGSPGTSKDDKHGRNGTNGSNGGNGGNSITVSYFVAENSIVYLQGGIGGKGGDGGAGGHGARFSGPWGNQGGNGGNGGNGGDAGISGDSTLADFLKSSNCSIENSTVEVVYTPEGKAGLGGAGGGAGVNWENDILHSDWWGNAGSSGQNGKGSIS